MNQPNYNKKLLKRKWQEKFFKLVKNRYRFIGLCGPNSKGYLKLINKLKFQTILLYDKDVSNLKLVPRQNNLIRFNEDINNHLDRNAFYDLDYCCNISTIKKYLPKIMSIKEFTITLALRSISEEKTLDILCKYKRNFLYRVYVEKGCPMMILYFPLKIK